MKNIFLGSVLILVSFSCSSEDDSGTTINLTLLYGTWNYNSTVLCPPQNNTTFNDDGSYVRIFSGNTCEFNESDTLRFTGTYTVNNDTISFNQLTESIIENGESEAPSVNDILPITLLSQKIMILTESELVIERLFRDDLSGQTFYSNWGFTR